METKRSNIFAMLILSLIIITSISCVYATSSSTEQLEARLSLWMPDGKTQILNKSTTELEAGSKVWIGYKPGENFKSIKYTLDGKTYEFNAKDKEYKSVAVTMPAKAGEYKMEMYAVLVDDTKSENKEYTFKIVKQEELIRMPKLSLWMPGGETLIANNSTTELVAIADVWIGYNDPDNYIKSIRCTLNGESDYFASQNYGYFEPEFENYESIRLTLPDKAGEYKMEMYATLKDGTETEHKQYTFKITQVEARLSLWKDSKTQISSQSITELEAGSKVWIGYKPEENFKAIWYGVAHINQECMLHKVDVEKENYKSIPVTLPAKAGEYKMEMYATLKDGTETEHKQYTFKITQVEARLSLWKDSETQISSQSITELEAGSKFWIGYKPSENFKAIWYGVAHIDQECLLHKVDVEKENYKSIPVTLPNEAGEYKIGIMADLVDGTTTETKEYRIKITKKVEPLEARLSLWMSDGKILIKNKSTNDMVEGSKVYIGYNPKENFKSIKYQIIPVKNSVGYIPNVKFDPVERKIEKDSEGNYTKFTITLPEVEGNYKLKTTATLIDGTKMEEKEYEFVIHKTGENNADINTTREWLGASEWAKEEVTTANENGLIPESLEKEIPTEGVTRKEFVAIAVKLYEAIIEQEIEVEIENPFVDTDDVEVLKAYMLGITTGVSETEFAPDRLITREQMATMMARAIEKLGIKIESGVNESFSDNNEISDWAKDSVYFMNENEIIKGMENNLFKAKNTATREQAIVIAQRCLVNLYSHK